MKNITRSTALSTIILTAGAMPVLAEPSVIEEIHVTARGWSELVQDVPDMVTAFSAEDIKRQEIRTIEDLISRTPGVYMINDQDPGTNIITVRGVSTDRLQAPSVAYVIDGVPLAETEFFTGRYFDVERIEVLKGPQGALYGKNAIGGVFNVVTRAPTDTLQGRGEIGYGNGETGIVEAGIGGPLLGDKLTFRVAGLLHKTGGFIHNTYLDKDVDDYVSRNFRGRLIGKLSDSLTADLRINLMDEEGGAAYVSSNNVTGLADGRLQGDVLTDPIGDFEGEADRQWFNISLKLDWETGEGGRISSISGYDDYSKDFIEELDFRNDTPITFFGVPFFPDGVQPIEQPKDIRVLTQELRYTSPADQRLRWTAGAFIQDVENIRVDDFGPLLFGGEAQRYDTDSTQMALFGQASLDITEALELTVALRYDRDERAVDVTGRDTGSLTESRKQDFDKFQPKVSLAYDLTDYHLLFATYSEGFKTGGFNPPPGTGDIHELVFRPEETKAYEVGAKTAWLNGNLVMNLSGFHTRYSNFQYFAFINGEDLAFNVNKVNVWGVEFSGAARPVENLTIDWGFGYTDSEIDEFSAPNPVTLIPTDYAGNKTPNNPEYTLNVGAEYALPISEEATIRLRADYLRVGKIHYEIDNVLYSPDRDSVDLRVAYERDSWSLALWARNLTDARWAISAFGQGQVGLLAGLGPNGPFDSFTINRGRQFGAVLAAEF
jgi:iron complex outermembrane receptor protein